MPRHQAGRRVLLLGALFSSNAAAAPSLAIGAALLAFSPPAMATPALTMDVATGDVLFQQDATQPWFPASTTKLMTVFVALEAVRDHKIALDTPLVVSARAHAMPPSKMGFRPGTQVTLDNALKMLMVKSANDIAVTVAEGVSGSVEAFADDMNAAAAEIGLHESHFVNPNGLPDPAHVSSARDMALIARALYTKFPEQAGLFDIGALQLGTEIIPNHNNLLGRYPGVDGMKTGFTCPAGFNVVASAYRDGRRIVTVVMGAPSVAMRTEKAAALFDRGFANIDRPTGSIVALGPSVPGGAPDMRNAICHARSALVSQFKSEVDALDAPLTGTAAPAPSLGLSALNPERLLLMSGAPAQPAAPPGGTPTALYINSVRPLAVTPVLVHVGAEPGYQGPVAEARAPHSPVGSEPVPAAAEAYAATPPGPVQGIGLTPLAVDPNALPLRGRRAKLAKGHRGRAGALNVAAEAAKTKVIAPEEGEEGGNPAKPSLPHKPAQAHAGASGKGNAAKPTKAAAKKAMPTKPAKIKKTAAAE